LLPASSLPNVDALERVVPGLPDVVTRDWAWGGADGSGVRVCILDSGVERDDPRVGPVDRAVVVSLDGEQIRIEEDDQGDVCGHGTACASVVRELAPRCAIASVRVVGSGFTGERRHPPRGPSLRGRTELRRVNMSLATSKRRYMAELHDIANAAFFGGTVLVASAHNMPVESWPWRFSSVISVGSHAGSDPFEFFYNPRPPVEFYGRGVNLDVAWTDGASITTTGNSFAAPHIAGLCALICSEHPGLTPFQVKSVLCQTAGNATHQR
jgi:subtilisin